VTYDKATDTSPERDDVTETPPEEAAAFVPDEELPDDVRDGDAGKGQEEAGS